MVKMMKRYIKSNAIEYEDELSQTEDSFDRHWNETFDKYYSPSDKTVTMTYDEYLKFAEEVKDFE